MAEDLLKHIKSNSIAQSLNWRFSPEEKRELKDILSNVSELKPLAVICDIIGHYSKAAKYYSDYTESLLLEPLDQIEDLCQSFIRGFTLSEGSLRSNISQKIYNFIIEKCNSESINCYQQSLIECFVLLHAQFLEKSFPYMIPIYYRLLPDNRYGEWLFNKEQAPFYIRDVYFPCPEKFFYNRSTQKDNLTNIINKARTRIEDLLKKRNLFEELKNIICTTYLEYEYDPIMPIESWIHAILDDEQKNTLKNLLKEYNKSIPPTNFRKRMSVTFDTASSELLEFIQNSNNLQESINNIISLDETDFLNENSSRWDELTEPGGAIIQPLKTDTGETSFNNPEKIKMQKLNILYAKIFYQLASKKFSISEIEALVNSWSIVGKQFHRILIEYLSSIFNNQTRSWQVQANINQIVLLLEQILIALNPDEYKKFNKGAYDPNYLELINEEYTKFMRKLLKDTESENGIFLLNLCREHRNSVAHGRTYSSFDNCYVILQRIIKVFNMDRSEFQ